MIDTHAHLQFKAFEGKVEDVIKRANNAGVEKIIVVGTNLETSKKAIELAEKYERVFASIGIHPHHVFPQASLRGGITDEAISDLESLLNNPKVIAIGETGLDRHIYASTKYPNYQITNEFIKLQKLFFKQQIKLAIKHKKSLIIHNRQAVPELLKVLEENWDPFLENRSVFHCCEPDQRLLDFAEKHKVFIGIDGDITYDKTKQEFIKKVPIELLVLETDSPYFTPEPLKSEGITLNEPKNLDIIADYIAILTKQPIGNVRKMSSKNSTILFKL